MRLATRPKTRARAFKPWQPSWPFRRWQLSATPRLGRGDPGSRGAAGPRPPGGPRSSHFRRRPFAEVAMATGVAKPRGGAVSLAGPRPSWRACGGETESEGLGPRRGGTELPACALPPWAPAYLRACRRLPPMSA